jgi:hypothetical protein
MRATHYKQNVAVQFGGTGSRYAMPEVLHGRVIFTSTPKSELVETLKSISIMGLMQLKPTCAPAERTQDIKEGIR